MASPTFIPPLSSPKHVLFSKAELLSKVAIVIYTSLVLHVQFQQYLIFSFIKRESTCPFPESGLTFIVFFNPKSVIEVIFKPRLTRTSHLQFLSSRAFTSGTPCEEAHFSLLEAEKSYETQTSFAN